MSQTTQGRFEGKVALVGSDFLPMKYWLQLEQQTPEVDWVPEDDLVREVRLIKSPRELELFREAGELVTRAHTALMEALIAGKTEGEAAVERRDGDSSRVLAELNAGEVFGEVGYIRAIERTADVVARTPVSALNFEYERMQKDLKFFPNIVAKLNFNISGILGERLADVLDSRWEASTPADRESREGPLS